MENNKAMNTEDLLLLKEQKMATFYKVKDSFETTTKDVDMKKRTVQVVPNTFYYFDSDQDVLISGSTTRTIQARGPNSVAGAKIKNVKDHVISNRIGNIQVLDERDMGGRKVQYAESKMLSTTMGNDMLIEYQEGVIDQHSIGFRYVDLEFITAEAKDWKMWIDQLINPQDCEDFGYMFIVKEISQFEYSPVSFGSNKLTPYLGVKSGNKDAMVLKVLDRVDLLEKQLKAGRQTDDTMMDYQLECTQLKQIISELFTEEPSIKATLLAQHRQNQDTLTKDKTEEVAAEPYDLNKWLNETKFIN